MRVEDWRALIAAYLDGRLSGAAFQRRFLEAWSADRETDAPAPRAISHLFLVVEGYDGGDDATLRAAAEDALSDLESSEGAPERLYDRFRTREDLRRFTFRMQGCLGLGCLIALAWLALVALQVFAVSDQIQSVLDWSAAPATFVGLFLAFVPVVGNVLAFFGAKDVWDWNPWIAGLVFFAAPAATMISGWMRWRAFRR
ncbi:MAG: hypothetical protein GC189_09750 [Alphaproteobacteria bacterium]|nr:hypothetical protein [Alphaproteobacteria bacterium]